MGELQGEVSSGVVAGRKCDGPELVAGNIPLRDRQFLSVTVDSHGPEELEAIRWWPVRLHVLRDAEESRFRSECIVEWRMPESARMEWAADEFPEWLKLLEHGLVRVVVNGGGMVNIRSEPDRVANSASSRTRVGDFESFLSQGVR